ncbi:MAG TPA: heparinase II/III family protein [Candidatus Limnocylindrales bacterium]
MHPTSRRTLHGRLIGAALGAVIWTTAAGLPAGPGAAAGAPDAFAADPTVAPTTRPVGVRPRPIIPPPVQPERGPGQDVDGLPLGRLEPVAPTPIPSTTRPVGRRLPRPALPGRCRGVQPAIARANDLLAGKYQLGTWPAVFVATNPRWTEDPFGDRNWQFMFHSLGAVSTLLEAWVLTADPRYYDQAEFLLHDWSSDNPRTGGPSIWAWNDHSTALRAAVYACAAPYFPGRPWMTAALDLHGVTLADPAFYVKVGNHALNQSIGLIEVGVVRGRGDWQELGAQRINALIGTSIDTQGVINEQSAMYQSYNLSRYRLAQARLTDLGLPVAPEFARLDLMPNFLAYATLPNGNLEQLGDTDYAPAPIWPGTWAEFAATRGASGPKPPRPYAIYNAGFIFARSGWGETRPFADEAYMSLRFGPAPFIHGHADGTSITFYDYGQRLLIDPGKLSYNSDPYRSFMKGRTAHNVVTVDGLSWSNTATTTLVRHAETATMIDATLSTEGFAGVTQQRHVTFSRKLNYLLVEDRATASTTRTFRQLWHLDETAAPAVSTNSFVTTHGHGNVLVRQLIGVSSSRIVKGATSPVQGWLSYIHGSKLTAPVVEVVRTGTSARYLTLLVPAAGTPAATVTGLTITASGYAVTITIGGHAERVTVSGTTTTVTTLS